MKDGACLCVHFILDQSQESVGDPRLDLCPHPVSFASVSSTHTEQSLCRFPSSFFHSLYPGNFTVKAIGRRSYHRHRSGVLNFFANVSSGPGSRAVICNQARLKASISKD
ncbi:hypothetical protein RRG08_013083 [Elysia crispata]|uniref:Uncharacterized protein n=1 Tax=Elysia crispata TaxID=231223 RepID=A0AAE1DQQ8_9GAST|nr:hypothetical protein RRG08_013083 [Elysia crispata]